MVILDLILKDDGMNHQGRVVLALVWRSTCPFTCFKCTISWLAGPRLVTFSKCAVREGHRVL